MTDANTYAASASALADACACAEGAEEGFGGGHGPQECTLAEYLPVVAWCVRTLGWVSRTAAREKGEGAHATADHVWTLTFDREAAKKANLAVSEEDSTKASQAFAWAEELSDEDVAKGGGDYLHNLRAVARSGLVNRKLAGIAASTVTAWERAMGKARLATECAALPQADVHVGTVGKRATWRVTLEFVTGYETAYGYTTGCRFRTTEGATLVWKASSTSLTREDAGKRYDLKGTVKAHSEYKGAKQTLVNRCDPTEVKEAAS